MKRISITIVDDKTNELYIDLEETTWSDKLVASFLRAIADEIHPARGPAVIERPASYPGLQTYPPYPIITNSLAV